MVAPIGTAPGISIIGGGMVGASLALLLNRALPDCPVRLFELHGLHADIASEGAAHWDARSTALAPTAVQLFAHMGLWEQLAPFATAIDRIHVSDQGSWGLSQFTRQDNQQQSLGQVVENAGLVRALNQALKQSPQIEVITGARVTQLLPRAGAMQIHWQKVQGESSHPSATSALVILADGADSPLRQSLGIAVREVPYEQTALVANVCFEQPHGGCAYERFCPSGPMAILPRGQSPQAQVGALIWTGPTQQQTELGQLNDTLLLAHLQTAFGYRLGRFTKIGARQFYPLRLVVAAEQVRSNLVLQGNAAHFLHPVAGQGFNLALRDGLRLAQVLSEGQQHGEQLGQLSQLQRYLQAAQTDQARTIAISDGFNRVFSRREPWWRWGRDLGMLVLETALPVRQAFIHQLSGRAHPVPYPKETHV